MSGHTLLSNDKNVLHRISTYTWNGKFLNPTLQKSNQSKIPQTRTTQQLLTINKIATQLQLHSNICTKKLLEVRKKLLLTIMMHGKNTNNMHTLE